MEIKKIDNEDYVRLKDMHHWIKKQAGAKGMLMTYTMFKGFIKNSDSVDVKSGV